MGLAAFWALAACARQPPPRPNELLFWRIVSSQLDFAQCTDDPGFRGQLQPVPFDENTYLVYRVEADGKKATAQSCESFSSSSCAPHPSGMVFEVAGNELLFNTQAKQPIGQEGCNLNDAQSWVLADRGESMDLEVSHVLGLVDHATACEAIESQIKKQSPNGLGLQGCVVRFQVSGALK